jgi:replication initiation and membrane attachment protein
MNYFYSKPFKIITYHNISTDERNSVTLLYQPIIGANALSVFFTLWSLVDRRKLKSTVYDHSTLLILLNMDTQLFRLARHKLEGVGLLNVYETDDEWYYELMAPMSPQAFLKNGKLGTFLFNEVGEKEFFEITKLFKIKHDIKPTMINRTVSFDDIFSKKTEDVYKPDGTFLNKAKKSIELQYPFDYDLFLNGLSKNFVDRRKITSRIKDKIISTAYIYALDESTMQKVFMDSVDQDRNLIEKDFEKNAVEWYTITSNSTLDRPGDIDLYTLCKNYKPIDIIYYISGTKPTKVELSTLQKLIETHQPKTEIFHFLIIYALSNQASLPSYNYLEKILVDWMRNKVNTVYDALGLVKQFRLNQSKPSINQNRTYKRSKKPDVDEDWLSEYE